MFFWLKKVSYRNKCENNPIYQNHLEDEIPQSSFGKTVVSTSKYLWLLRSVFEPHSGRADPSSQYPHLKITNIYVKHVHTIYTLYSQICDVLLTSRFNFTPTNVRPYWSWMPVMTSCLLPYQSWRQISDYWKFLLYRWLCSYFLLLSLQLCSKFSYGLGAQTNYFLSHSWRFQSYSI